MRIITHWCNIYVSREDRVRLSERFYEGYTKVWKHKNFWVLKDYMGNLLIVEEIPEKSLYHFEEDPYTEEDV